MLILYLILPFFKLGLGSFSIPKNLFFDLASIIFLLKSFFVIIFNNSFLFIIFFDLNELETKLDFSNFFIFFVIGRFSLIHFAKPPSSILIFLKPKILKINQTLPEQKKPFDHILLFRD